MGRVGDTQLQPEKGPETCLEGDTEMCEQLLLEINTVMFQRGTLSFCCLLVIKKWLSGLTLWHTWATAFVCLHLLLEDFLPWIQFFAGVPGKSPKHQWTIWVPATLVGKHDGIPASWLLQGQSQPLRPYEEISFFSLFVNLLFQISNRNLLK